MILKGGVLVLIPNNNYHIKNPKNEIDEEEEDKNPNEFNLTVEMWEFINKR